MTPQNSSRRVNSKQKTVHPRLGPLLDAHLARPWRQPLHGPTVEAFGELERIGISRHGPIVLDSGCGTGESTRRLAQAFPDSLVIGVDKSLTRLGKTGVSTFPHREANAIWLRAELSTFWRLANEAGWRLQQHFLLYPNPWPKPGQLQRRWHAHPVFPQMLGLGGRIELRCNWEVYALEFAAAVNRVLGLEITPRPVGESVISSPFERKYRASGHALYSVVVPADSSGVK